jgi:APA family basic amino acid/polyamine antiporter
LPQLEKKLNLFDLTMISIGSVIGSGIFLTPALIAGALPSPGWIMTVWILGGVMALTGALTYSELSGMMPRAGGLYVFLAEAYGGLLGFLYGWVCFLVVNTGSYAALAMAFATYFGYFVPLSATGVKSVAIGGIVFLTLLNMRGSKAGAIFSDLFTVLKVIGILGLIAIGLGWGGGGEQVQPLFDTEAIPGGLAGALAVAMVGVIFSCGGWQHATFMAGEARNARRNVPMAMIIAAITITLIYILTNAAYLSLMSPAEIAGSERVAADAVKRVIGPIGGGLIALAIFISTFGTTGIYTLTSPRIYFAMARDGVFFDRIAEVHPRYNTPVFAILSQSIWAIVLILFWGTFENLISYVVFSDAIFFSLAAAAVIVLRWRSPGAERPVRTLGSPVTPLIFIGINAWFVVRIVWEKPLESLAGLGFMLLGVPVYYLVFRKRKEG